MAAGDSITAGYNGLTNMLGNGFRKFLKDDITSNKANQDSAVSVDYVGSEPGYGSMIDGWNQGYSGKETDYIDTQAKSFIDRYLPKPDPNVITILSGTNDIGHGHSDGAPQRLVRFVHDMRTRVPDAYVLVGDLLPDADRTTNFKHLDFNSNVARILDSEHDNHVIQVNFDDLSPTTDMVGLHPNDMGYKKMADDWDKPIEALINSGALAPRSPVNDLGKRDGGVGGGDLPVGVPNFQQGVRVAEAPATTIKSDPGSTPLPGGAYVIFGDLTGTGLGNYIQVGADNSLTAWTSIVKDGKIRWGGLGKIFDGVKGGLVQMADINGDGKDDYTLIAPDGGVTAYLNGGHDPSAPNGWKWTKQDTSIDKDTVGRLLATVHKEIDHVEFADLDGDGYDDHILITKDGAPYVALNQGKKAETSKKWLLGQSQGSVGLPAPDGVPPGSKVHFADVNGDGRADYLVMNATTGATRAYLSKPTSVDAQTGKRTFTFKDVGPIASGVGPAAQVRWADLDGDGKADFVFVTGRPNAGKWYHNGGADSTAPSGWVFNPRGDLAASAGEETVFADMNGDGKADIVRIASNGSLTAQFASGTGFTPTFGNSVALAPGIGVPGEQIQLADIDGDGKADYLNVDPKTGAVTAFFNQGPSGAGGGYAFSAPVKIAGGVAPGAQIRFADMRNIGRADYVVVNPTTGGLDDYENCGYDKTTQHQCWFIHPKIAGGLAPGDQVRLAPVFGTGRADYLIVHPNGSVDAYVNGGPNDAAPAPGHWLWIQQKKPIAGGVGAPGEQIQFADLNGNKFADYLIVKPDGSVEDWANAGLIPAS